MKREQSMQKHERIRGATGVKIRRKYLKAHPRCVLCEARGKISEAQEVDHIIPLHQGGTNHTSNYQALCKECHRLKTIGEHSELMGKPKNLTNTSGYDD